MATNGKAKEQTGPQVQRLGYVLETEERLVRPANAYTWYKKVRQMRRDPTVSLVRRLVIAPALASSWSIEKNADAPEGAVDLISEFVDAMRVHLIDFCFRGCIDFGWQPFEIVYGVDTTSGNVVIKKLKPLLQDFTDILIDEKTGAYAGLQQGDGINKVQIDIENTFVHYWDNEGTDWYGEPLMRAVEGPYDASIIVQDSANRYDTKIAGSHWVIHYPEGRSYVNGALRDNYDIAVEFLQALRSSGSIAIPSTVDPAVPNLSVTNEKAWKVELLTDSGAASTTFISRQQYLDALKARAFGVPERAVLEGQYGTKAEAQEHGEMSVVIVEMRHSMLCQSVNWHAVNRLLRYNYGEQYENTVWVKPSPLTDKQRTYYRDLYNTILTTPDGFLQELDNIDTAALRDKLDIPTTQPDILPGLLPGLMPGLVPEDTLETPVV